jgi:Xaa-Pro aminopeptidase
MKSDLDRLMTARDLQALIVAGGHGHNAPRDYLTNSAHITGGLVIKKRGDAPVMVVNAMEVEEADKSGLTVYTMYDLGWAELVEKAEGNRSKAEVGMWGRCLEKFGVPAGNVGVYGTGDLNMYIELIRMVELAYPDYKFVGELGMTLFDEAYITKDADEIKRIKSVAVRTSTVWQTTWDFIAGHRAEGDTVVKSDGSPLTIGDVKRFVRRELLDHDLQDNDMIFAQGRDGGFPHSRGEADMALQLGQAIVFDLFPSELGGGYYHDSTRTWCIGYAPDEVQAVFDQVMDAFDIAVDSFRIGQPTHMLQDAVLDYFESKGHPTMRSQPGAMDGYVHSLGHGVGLNIHERPSITHVAKTEKFQPGNVVTIEPGLYYPEKGYGVRVEDMCYVDEQGQLVHLTDFRKDLVLPLRG